MKRINLCLFFIVTILLLSLTGCIEGQMHISFNLDGSADVDFELYSSSALGMFQREGEDFFDDMRRGLVRDGFTIEEKQRDGMTGFRAHKRVSDVEELTELTFLGDMEAPEIEITESFFYDTYEFTHDMKIPLPGFEGQEDSLAGMLNADINFLLSFPINPESHNADTASEDGNTMQWAMSLEDENNVEVVVNVPNAGNIALVVIAGLAVIILIIVIAIKVTKKDVNDKPLTGNKK